ncbi:MAG: hypothetical protein ACE5GH_00930, partial [Fidelibacterota bacterium]
MRFNLNRLLKLQIRGKLAIAFAGLSILPVLVVGLLGISSNISSMRRVAFESLSNDLITVKDRLGSFFQGMEDNIHFLTASSSFHRFVEVANRHSGQELSSAMDDLMPELVAFAEWKGIFYQIKFINVEGDEVFSLE